MSLSHQLGNLPRINPASSRLLLSTGRYINNGPWRHRPNNHVSWTDTCCLLSFPRVIQAFLTVYSLRQLQHKEKEMTFCLNTERLKPRKQVFHRTQGGKSCVAVLTGNWKSEILSVVMVVLFSVLVHTELFGEFIHSWCLRLKKSQ